MSRKIRIAIAGVGNLGWNLANRLDACGFTIRQLIARKTQRTLKLAKKLDADLSDDIEQLKPKVELLFVCVPDDQITDIAKKADRSGLTVVHCSGHMPVLDLKNAHSGVLYPFQTFTKYFLVDWTQIPVFVESPDKETRQLLRKMAEQIAGEVHEVSHSQRQAIHLAGVFGANFVNHLMYQCQKILDPQKIPLEVTRPLLEETIRKVFHLGPAGAQTGPARRRDQRILEAHLRQLSDMDDTRSIYRIITDSILKTYT